MNRTAVAAACPASMAEHGEERDIFKTDVSAATVVAFYLLPDFNLELRPKLLEELKPGTRLVSHDGDMGDWPPDAKIVVDAPGKRRSASRRRARSTSGSCRRW